MKTLTISFAAQASSAYPIYIGRQLYAGNSLWHKHLASNQVMIITNESIARWYLAPLQAALTDYQCDSLILPDGEAYKDLAHFEQIITALLEKHHHRQTTLIALGGGVIGDMTGFAAACYQRGVHFIQIPTTLLAQVDASVGGKTAVNHPLGKNLIGAFHQPQCVVIDTDTLVTLPDRDFKAGLAEAIKHAWIAKPVLFETIEAQLPLILRRDPTTLGELIAECVSIKAAVVAHDEREQGQRAILNFGHTVAHAVEQQLGYGVWLHGEAVALGMIVAATLSESIGLGAQDKQRLIDCLAKADLPTQAPALSAVHCWEAMALDKKASQQGLTWVLTPAIGQAMLSTAIDKTHVLQALYQVGFTH